jgi:hypothetical protein
MTVMKLPKETASAAEAIFDLLYALQTALPELAAALRQGARVTFDVHEGAFIVGARQPDGTSRPLLAIACDAADRESFGDVGVPVTVPPQSITH